MIDVEAAARIWMYWQSEPGTQRPPYLDACEATVRMNAGRLAVVVLDERTAAEHAGPLPAAWARMSPVQRADWVRVRVVHRHGGLWIDADTIALQPLDQLVDELTPRRPFVGYGADGLHNGLFAALAGAPVLGEWARRQDAVLRDADPATLHWTALGSSIAEAVVDEFDWTRIDHRRIAPVDWQDWDLLLSRTYPLAKVLEHDPLTIMLYNAAMAPRLEAMRIPQLVNGLMLCGRALRHAYGLGQRRAARVAEMAHPVGVVVRRAGHRRAYRSRVRARAR